MLRSAAELLCLVCRVDRWCTFATVSGKLEHFFKDCSTHVRLIVGSEKEKLNAAPAVSES